MKSLSLAGLGLARVGRSCRVAFNDRSSSRTQVKDLLMRGEVGEVLSVDFHWLLNTRHGTDYFRRWHGRREIFGGPMAHESSPISSCGSRLGTVVESLGATQR